MSAMQTCGLWKMATDSSTRTKYFYNIESDEVQWDPPTVTLSGGLGVEWKCTVDAESGQQMWGKYFSRNVNF
jgi:hypothetical protein